jgi:hypothetical protein
VPGLATLYSAFILFVVEKQAADIAWLGKLLFCSAILFMLGSFLLSLMATQIAAFQIPNEPTDIIEGFGDDPPTDEEFFDDRIIEYALACETNSSVNDRKADMLQYARYLLLGGIAMHASYFVARIHSSSGCVLFSQPAICSGEQSNLSFRATARRSRGLVASLQHFGRRDRAQAFSSASVAR